MKRSLTTLALTLCLSPLLMQCAAEKDVRGLDMRLRTTDTKIAEMDNTVIAMQNQRGSIAELANQLEQIKSRLLQLEARVEEKNIQTRKIQEEQTLLKKNNQHQFEQLRGQLTELNIKLSGVIVQVASFSDDFTHLQENRAKETSERATSAAKIADEARKKTEIASAPKIIEPEQTKKKPGKTEESVKSEEIAKSISSKTTTVQDAETNTSDTLYNKGLAAYKANKYKEAYNTFSSYLEKNRTAPLAPNARFWLGECLFQQKEFELAILEYQKVIADYPKNNKASAALFKQGQAFENLAEKDTAKIVYNKLLADYPKSEQVEMAQKRLKVLK
ncbi:MAG TPA: tol-pal system protein YbgF [Desulfobulbaceae bacterium]|nr:MAG: tol-pal system protein YbgF [Deltaproteobacteria bacterium RIFOXYD12_FULL_53_23]HCC54710.1 tol-pal system protein YbgF [Desulfobulbaceae bacterium]